jgi:hypothetical protein
MQTNPGLFRDIKSTLNWSLFTDDVALAAHFGNNIAPLASESQSLYPSGTAANIKGDGTLTFYSNFYNNPFNGFIINGSPSLKSYLSGGEGEVFYSVESEGDSPIDMEIIANTYHPIESDPNITGFGSYQLNPDSEGVIKVLNTTSFGAPNVGYRINNGKLIIQSAFQTVSMQSFVEASGDASVSVEGSYLRNGMSRFHGIARSDSADIQIVGSYSDNNYRVSSDVFVSGSTPRAVIAIDVLPPSTPLSLQAEAISNSQIDLSWESSTDNVNVAGYYIYRDGTKIAEIAETNYSDTGLSKGTFYDYFVIAFDETKNKSIPTDTLSISTLSVGIGDSHQALENLKIYPNPAKGRVFVSIPQTGDGEVEFELYSVSGTLIWSENFYISDKQNEFSMDISHLKNGLYLYQLTNKQRCYTGKFYIYK